MMTQPGLSRARPTFEEQNMAVAPSPKPTETTTDPNADLVEYVVLGAAITYRTGRAGAATEERVSITSTMRSAETAARGTIMNMNVDIMTAIRMNMM